MSASDVRTRSTEPSSTPRHLRCLGSTRTKRDKDTLSAISRDGSPNPPGEAELPDPVPDWASCTASQIWLLGSVMPLVSRPLFSSPTDMVRRPIFCHCCSLCRVYFILYHEGGMRAGAFMYHFTRVYILVCGGINPAMEGASCAL